MMAQEADKAGQKKTTLELYFISFVGVVVVGAFVAALSYDFVSARTPLVVMVPLLLLIAAQFNRTRRASKTEVVLSDLSHALKGRNKQFNSVAGLIGWTILLMLLILVAGHYAGIAAFMFVLLRLVSKETKLLSVLTSVGVTVIIYFLFERGFNIELYRGLIYKLLSG